MNNYINYESNMLSMFNGLQPYSVKGVTNTDNYYQKRYLWNKIYSCFDFDLSATNIDLNTFRFILFRKGSIALFNIDNEWVASPYMILKWNRYYNPYLIKNVGQNQLSDFKQVESVVNKDAVIIKCFDDYLGFEDLVSDYSNTLAMIDKAVKVASMNANVNLIAFARNKKEATEIEMAYESATSGKPLILINDKFKDVDELNANLLQPFTNHDTTSIMDKLLNCRRMVINNFLTEIGISNANVNKKERLVTDEVNANNDEVSANITIVYENIKSAFETFEKISGLHLDVKLHYSYELSEVEESGVVENV